MFARLPRRLGAPALLLMIAAACTGSSPDSGSPTGAASPPGASPAGSPAPVVRATELGGTGLRFSYPDGWRVARQGRNFWVLANFAVRGDETDEELSPGQSKIDLAVEPVTAQARTRQDLSELYCAEGLDTEVLECDTEHDIGGRRWLWALTRSETPQPTAMRVAATVDGGAVYTAFAFVPEGRGDAGLLATAEAVLATLRIG